MSRLAVVVLLFAAAVADAEDAKALLAKGQAAAKEGKNEEALKFADEAIKANPKLAEAYDLRGTMHFKLAHIKESLADYDKQIELDPTKSAAHWRRGLTLYYADKFAEGVSQFTTSDKAEPEDVENAIWHFLCNARVKGVDKARGEFLKVKEDPRGDYMMTIYKMFKGDAKPEDVSTVAEAGQVNADERHIRRFYANYYVGMYYEIAGEPKKSLAALKKAVEKYPIGHYMMDVARVHIKLRAKK